MYPFFAMLSRMKYINRWGLMRNTRSENICEHSLEVALIAHALATVGNQKFGKSYNPERAALLAVFHDAPEIITGDMPTPVKYHSGALTAAYKEVERGAAEKLVSMLPVELQSAYEPLISGKVGDDAEQLVKAADRLSAYIKCIEERKAGNLEFKKAGEQTYEALRQNPLPALAYFMERFLPGFHLTLDELQGSGDEIFGQTTLDLTSGKEGTQL